MHGSRFAAGALHRRRRDIFVKKKRGQWGLGRMGKQPGAGRCPRRTSAFENSAAPIHKATLRHSVWPDYRQRRCYRLQRPLNLGRNLPPFWRRPSNMIHSGPCWSRCRFLLRQHTRRRGGSRRKNAANRPFRNPNLARTAVQTTCPFRQSAGLLDLCQAVARRPGRVGRRRARRAGLASGRRRR